jgi:hypothetical protein
MLATTAVIRSTDTYLESGRKQRLKNTCILEHCNFVCSDLQTVCLTRQKRDMNQDQRHGSEHARTGLISRGVVRTSGANEEVTSGMSRKLIRRNCTLHVL